MFDNVHCLQLWDPVTSNITHRSLHTIMRFTCGSRKRQAMNVFSKFITSQKVSVFKFPDLVIETEKVGASLD